MNLSSKFSELYLKLSKKEKVAFWDFSNLKVFKLSDIDKRAIVILSEKLTIKKETDLDNYLFQELFEEHNETNRKAFEYIKSHLLTILISFFRWQLSEKSIASDVELLDYFQRKKAKRNFESSVRKFKKTMLKKPTFYLDAFYNMQVAEIELAERESRTRENIEIQQANEANERLFIINRLRFYCMKINECNLRNLDYPKDFLKPLEAMNLEHYLEEDLLVSLYYSMANMLKDATDFTSYHQTLALIKANEHKIERSIFIDFFTYLRNRCSYYCNAGEAGFTLHFLDLVEYLEAKNLLVIDDIISLSMYKNVISSALIYHRFDWAKNFIEQYAPFIPRKEKYGIKLFHQADLKYQQGDLDMTFEYLSIIEKKGYQFKDQFYHISYNKLLLKIYLMKNITVGFHNKIDTFKRYIYNKQNISKVGKEASLAFVSAAKKIYKKEPINLEIYKGKLTALDYKWLEEIMKKQVNK